jgi:glycosyltransferase involved in cell wall biosynthesis
VNEALDRLQALEPHVRFRSHDPDVKNIYADVDAVLVPSLAESFCRIAAEAMMNRLPVVASDLPALRELLAGVDAELLFRVGDVDTAAGAIRRVASDPDVQARVAERAARRVAAFTPDHVVEKLLQLYGLTR